MLRTRLCTVLFVLLIGYASAAAQSTMFTYQGRLLDNNLPPTANYDFEFRLFGVETGGTALGTLTRSNVVVEKGIFTVTLDFFGSSFPGANRWLEIAIKPAGSPNPFTVLVGRQPVTSAPYAIKSALAEEAISAETASFAAEANNANSATTAITATDAINAVTAANAINLDGRPGSGYIQNTTTQQALSDFNISGTGTAPIFRATTQFNIGSNRILSAGGTNNLFAGVLAGDVNTGTANSFFGSLAGRSNTSAGFNSFFGRDAGRQTETGGSNSFFGANTGVFNVSGEQNSFFGDSAGLDSSGSFNAFFGRGSGRFNQGGSLNTFIGWQAGNASTTGSNNTAIGADADVGAGNLTFSTAIGAGSVVTASNTIRLGRSAGQDTVQIPGTLQANLDAASITTGLLPMSRGGTGVGTSGADGTFLRSTGSFWGISRIRAEDLPTGSNNYIRNQTVQQAGANFNIFGGTGTASVFNAITQFNIGGKRVLAASDWISPATGGNLFLGIDSGIATSTGYRNTFVGHAAGLAVTTGADNVFVGEGSGAAAESGSSNVFIGTGAGAVNTSNSNTFIGVGAGATSSGGSFNTAIGFEADTPSVTVQLPGFPPSTSHAFYSTAIGAGVKNSIPNSVKIGRSGDNVYIGNSLNIGWLEAGGSTDLCLNADEWVSTCSSSLRYKSNVQSYTRGLDVLRQLRPVTFNWNTGGKLDLGFGAEEVAVAEPLLVTTNSKGEIEGVKYKQITTVLVNAVKEQQKQIEAQKKQLEELRSIVCEIKPNSSVCKKETGNEK